MIASYWLFLTGAVFIAGSFIARIIVTSPSGAELCVPGKKRRCLGEAAGRMVLWAALATFVVSLVHAVFHAAVMTETPLNEVFSIMTVFLTKTKYGRFTLLRSVLVVFLVVVAHFSNRKRTKTLDFMGALISLALLLSICVSGHEGAEGYLNLPFAMDILHMLSVTTWIGGVFYIFMGYSFLMEEAGAELWATLRAMMNRFSDLATVCVTVAVLSGASLAYFRIESFDQLTGTPYGITLMVKVMLASVILAMGAANKFYVMPRINSADMRREEDLGHIGHRLHTFVSIEAYVGVGVMLATALLTHLSPHG